MLDLNFNFIFNIVKLFKSKDKKHELKYEDFLKSLDGLDNDDVINLISLRLINCQFDLLLIIKGKDVIKTLGENDILDYYKIVKIPIIKNGKVKYNLILGTKNENKFKLNYKYIELLGSYLT